MHFIRSVGYSAIWYLVQDDNVTKTINISLAHFRFLKKLQTFLMLAGHHACNPTPTPTKISTDILLPAAKTFGLKLA